ncbi:nitrate- and nitrite sensing domain-containing protein [Streptomyces sp. NPDC050704]|uniref:sensor histidine kinase n=1 Tax=Streptomyces sp. NPDC050704 TaxID=3157219 RepID=UPI003424CE64
MRAPVQMMRPRRKGRQSASGEASGRTPNSSAAQDTPDPAGRGRPAHVRSRLIIAVAVVAAAIAGAGAPSVIAASGELNDSQNLVTLAERTQDALALAHSLADERDEVTSYLAAGRPDGEGPSERRSARVDRQVEELRAEAVEAEAPAAFRKSLDSIATVRRAALTGESSALEAHRSYSAVLAELHGLAEELAEQIPPRAGAGAHALADLDTAVQQAAAARGLLLAALNVPTSTRTTTDPITGLPVTTTTSSAAQTRQRDALSAAAQQANVREQAALADFHGAAPKTDRASYDSTVTGPDVTSAEKYLTDLADQPTLSDGELGTGTKKLDAALSARVELMRGVEASLNTQRAKELAQLRDDDVTALEIRIALLGALMLLAVGVSTAMARTLTRPLAVLRLGSARLAAEPATVEPVKFTGRNDEFAQVVRSVNALHAHARALQERLTTLEGDRKHLIGQRQKMADERDHFRTELAEATAHLERVRDSVQGTFVNLALRTLGLVERQLGVIEGLEEREQDPERLATLFRLDHFATVMRRHSENLLVLAGAEHGHQHPGPVPLVDVVRAAVSEIERYERVRIAALPPHAHLAGFAADDVSHLLAELLENASSFSPPDIPVEVSGWLLESGEVMLSVQDEGIGMTGDRLGQLNARLADFDAEGGFEQESGEGLGLGLYVVARLAHRHGLRVQLREQKQGGITAVVVLPKALLAAAPSVAVPSATTAGPAGSASTMSLPGANAEVNSNVLPSRSGRDPLIAAAENSLRDTGAAGQGSPAEETARADAGAEELVREEPVREESTREAAAADRPAGQEPASEQGVRGESADREAGATDSVRREFDPSDPAREEPVRREFGAADSVRGDAGASDPARREAEDADAVRREAEDADAVRRGFGAADSVRGEAGATDPARREAEDADAVRRGFEAADSVRGEAGATDPVRREAEDADPVRRGFGAADSVRGEAGASDPVRREAEDADPVRGGFGATDPVREDSVGRGFGVTDLVGREADETEIVGGESGPPHAETTEHFGTAEFFEPAELPEAAEPLEFSETAEASGSSDSFRGSQSSQAFTPSDTAHSSGSYEPSGLFEFSGVSGPSESSEPSEAAPGPETTMELIPPPPPAEEASGVGIPAQATTEPQQAHDPYAIGPDAHERVSDRRGHDGPQESEQVTDKGLPKRTPKISAPPPAARPRAGAVDAEALRRRLGGFHRGANDGRRDVEAEIAEQTSELKKPAVHAVETQGDTVEEASS